MFIILLFTEKIGLYHLYNQILDLKSSVWVSEDPINNNITSFPADCLKFLQYKIRYPSNLAWFKEHVMIYAQLSWMLLKR